MRKEHPAVWLWQKISQRHGGWPAWLAVLVMLLPAAHLHAPASGVVGNGSPASCSEAALDNAVSGGGLVTFNCGPAPVTIVLHTTITIGAPAHLKGGGLITLSGGGLVRPFDVPVGTRLSLDDLTITQGLADLSSGGGIRSQGVLTLTNTILTNNHASSHGGAVQNYGSLKITGGRFEGNTAGVNGGAIDTTLDLAITGTQFISNTAGFRGGAINNYLGSLTLITTRFERNTSNGYGGGVVNDGGTGSILGSSFFTNTAQSIGGGVRNSGSLEIFGSVLSGNSASDSGGAIENSGALKLHNTTLSDNHAASQGGGVFNQAGASAMVDYSTLADNTTSLTSGGNLDNSGSLSIQGSIVAGGQPLNCNQPISSKGYNLEDRGECGLNAVGDLSNTNPMLLPLQDNGGPAFTQAPQPGAPGVDHIPGAACAATDGRGLPRPQGAGCDAGAVELIPRQPLLSTAGELPWPMRAHDSRHTGRSGSSGPDDPRLPGAPWPFQANARILAAPAVDFYGNIYFGSQSGVFYSVSANGGTNFTYRAGGAIRTGAALVSDGTPPPPLEESIPSLLARVYFGADDGRLYALHTPDGGFQWSLALSSSPLVSGLVADKIGASILNRVYVGGQDGTLYAVFETASGPALQWQVQTGAPLTTTPALSADGARLYLGGADGFLYCLDAANGAVLTKDRLDGGSPLTSPLVDASERVIVGSASGRLFAFDRLCHPLPYWGFSLPGSIRSMPVESSQGQILVSVGDTLTGFDFFGRLLWTQAFGHPLQADSLAADAAGTVIAASADGWLFGVDSASGGVKWNLQVDSGPAPYLGAPVMDAAGRILLASGASALQVIDDTPAYLIAFQSDQQAPGNTDLYSLRETYGILDPARTQRLTRRPEPDLQPAYGLDRSRLAFAITQTGAADIYLGNAIAAAEANLSQAPASNESEPFFSPVDDRSGASLLTNGRRYLVYTSDASGLERLAFLDFKSYENGSPQVYSLATWASLQGAPPAVTGVLEPPDTRQSQPAFSPSGEFLAWRHCDLAGHQASLRLLILAGVSSSVQTIGPPVPIEGSAPCSDFWPVFSPDSRWVALRLNAGLAIFSVSAVGPQPTLTASLPAMGVIHPSWAPDGSEIALGGLGGTAVDLYTLSGPRFQRLTRLTTSATSARPFYHYFKMPPPVVSSFSPAQAAPGNSLLILGRGFDILHKDNNQVFFTDTLHTAWLPATVSAAAVYPEAGLGGLTVSIPPLAGNGRLLVRTRYGQALSSAEFYVLPRPASLHQPASVPGAKIKIYGVGIDLVPASQYQVGFPASAGGWVTNTASVGGIAGQQEYLVVQVPEGVAEQGSPRLQNSHGSGGCACQFTLLHPSLSVTRQGGLPWERAQGCSGLPVTASGQNFPYDPDWGYGVTTATLHVEGASPGGAILSAPLGVGTFTSHSSLTATLSMPAMSFPALPGGSGGDVQVVARDSRLLQATAQGNFRTPLLNIPIIFVPGTSGTSLDNTAPPNMTLQLSTPLPFDLHSQEPECFLCPPVQHPAAPYFYLTPLDPFGRRVWVGPEMLNHLIGNLLINAGNHYMDILKFDNNGENTLEPNHYIQPGTVLDSIMLPPPLPPSDIYAGLSKYLVSQSGLNRPYCPDPGGTCLNSYNVPASGSNGYFPYPYDWRNGVPGEVQRLANFIDAVLNRPDVKAAGITRVALISHSYGSLISRAYYMEGNNAQKVDQLISMGGGMLGIPLVDKILEMGDTWDRGISFGAQSVGFAEWEIQSLGQNWPTAYFQTPNSQEWFWDDTRAGGSQNRAFIIDDRPGGPGELHTLSESEDWIQSRHNSTLTQLARTYFNSHPWLGDFRYTTNGVYHQRIISVGLEAVRAVHVWRDYSGVCKAAIAYAIQQMVEHNVDPSINPNLIAALIPECTTILPDLSPRPNLVTWREPLWENGDGTVLYHSALGRVADSDDHVYVLTGIKHTDMVANADVLDLLKRMFSGSVCSQTQAPAAFGARSPDHGAPPLGPAAATAQLTPDRWRLRLLGPARLDVYDGLGRHTGPSPDPQYPFLFNNAIPGVLLSNGSSASSLSLPLSDTFTLTLKGQRFSGIDLNLTSLAGSQELSTTVYAGLLLTATSQALLRFDAHSANPPAIQLDFSGNGQVYSLAPAASLGASTAADSTPPSTTIHQTGQQVSLSAADNPGGSGVLSTIYQTNLMPGFQVYSGTLTLMPGEYLHAFSIDRKGNVETPGVSTRQGVQTYLPLISH
jgi:predicted outer membrane repeat protein